MDAHQVIVSDGRGHLDLESVEGDDSQLVDHKHDFEIQRFILVLVETERSSSAPC